MCFGRVNIPKRYFMKRIYIYIYIRTGVQGSRLCTHEKKSDSWRLIYGVSYIVPEPSALIFVGFFFVVRAWLGRAVVLVDDKHVIFGFE